MPSGIRAFQDRGTKGLIAFAVDKSKQGIKVEQGINWGNLAYTGVSLLFPIIGGARLLQTGVTQLLGSKEDKAKNLAGYNPTLTTWKYKTPTGLKKKEFSHEELMKRWIDYEKKTDPRKKEWWEDLKWLPELPKLPSGEDLKKYLLIGGVAIGGLFLLGKYIGRK